MTTISINLPDSLVREASSAGLLTHAAIEQMVRDRLREYRLERLNIVREKLDANPLPAMTQGEIDAEIAAYRTGRRRAAGS